MSRKSERIARLVQRHESNSLDPHYLGYFECFNRDQFYEAHDVLEELWLADRGGPDDGFYKGLIQFAGAFVHLQKNRLRPAVALFKLSRSYLQCYPPVHKQLSLTMLFSLLDEWQHALEESGFSSNPLHERSAPRLRLLSTAEA